MIRTIGKLLLRQILLDAHLPQALEDISYDAWGKPSFNDPNISFSITHSSELAICAVCMGNAMIGIDAEIRSRIQLREMVAYLSPEEQHYLNSTEDKAASFLALWTRKEAVLKAAGYGVEMPFALLEVLQNPVVFSGRKWYWIAPVISPDYIVHLASSAPPEEIVIRQITSF